MHNSRRRPAARQTVIPHGPRSTIPPSWRDQQREKETMKRRDAANQARQEAKDNALKVHLQPVPGSAILIEGLPFDALPGELEELFATTVGYVVDAYLLYNDKGYPKGKGYVQFSHPSDAALARRKYHGRVIDGRSPIRVRLVIDTEEPEFPRGGLNGATQPRSLAGRIHPQPTQNVNAPPPLRLSQRLGPPVASPLPIQRLPPTPSAVALTLRSNTTYINQPLRARVKKGPRRTAKRAQRLALARDRPAVAADLDADLDKYMSMTQTGLLR